MQGVVLICCWILVFGLVLGFFSCLSFYAWCFLSVLSMSLGTNCSWCRNMPNLSHTTGVKKSLYSHCLTTPALGEEEKRKHSFFNPYSKPVAARQERSEGLNFFRGTHKHGLSWLQIFWRERALSEVWGAQPLMQTYGFYLYVSIWASWL